MSDMGFVRGMCVGIVAGAAVGAMLMPKRRRMKSAAGKAIKTAGEILDQITDVIGI